MGHDIIYGGENLPEKWVKLLGNTVAVSDGIKNIRVPETIDELTSELCAIGENVLKRFNAETEVSENDDFRDAEAILKSLINDIKSLWSIPPNKVDFNLTSIKVSVIYLDGPAVLPNEPNRLIVSIENMCLTPVSGMLRIYAPSGWMLEPAVPYQINLDAGEKTNFRFSVTAPVKNINASNECLIKVLLNDRPRLTSVPIVFVGGFRWLISEVFREPLSLDFFFPPRKRHGSLWCWRGMENSFVA